MAEKPMTAASPGARSGRSVHRREAPPPVQWSDLGSIERIVQATISAPGGEKLDASLIDRMTLKEDLDWALVWYRNAGEFGSTTLAAQRDKRWRNIHETAHKLLRLLREDERDTNKIGSRYPLRAPAPRPIILDVALAAIACRRRPKKPTPLDDLAQNLVRWATMRSPADFLAGELLPPVFTKHFGIERAGYTTRDGDTDGPAIRFAESVFRECGITHGDGQHYQRSFFAAAQTNARKERRRRNRLPNKQKLPRAHVLSFRHADVHSDRSSPSDPTRRRLPWTRSRK